MHQGCRGAAVGCWTAVILIALLAPGATSQTVTPPEFTYHWGAAGARDHALVGQVWSAKDDSLLPLGALPQLLDGYDYTLLGEVHDNPDHHALRAALLWERLRHPKRAAVVVEHVRTDQAEALARLRDFAKRARRAASVNDLMRFLDWKNSGWPSAAIFAPLYRAVLATSGLPVPGDPPRRSVRAVAGKGLGALASEDVARLKLDVPLGATLRDDLLAELEASHCGLMPKHALETMAMAQRFRDAHFAEAMIAARASQGSAVLLAGNGHARNDRGVPWYIRQREPGASVLSVMLVEVEGGTTDPRSYVERARDGAAAADLIVFTPRAERPDPCEEMRKQFGKK